jgi:hypothetical protein
MKQLILLGTVHRDPSGKKRLARVLGEIRPGAVSLEVSPASIRIRSEKSRVWRQLFRTRLRGLSRETGRSLGSLMTHRNIRGVFEYLRLPYEYRAAIEYAQSHQVPLFLLDDSELAAAYLNRVEAEILTDKNITLLAKAESDGSLAREVDLMYEQASHLVGPSGFKEKNTVPKAKDRQAFQDRETAMSQKLRLLHQGLARRAGMTLPGNELAAGLIVASEAIGFLPDTVRLESDQPHLYICGWEHLVEDEDQTSLCVLLKDLDPQVRLCHTPARFKPMG